MNNFYSIAIDKHRLILLITCFFCTFSFAQISQKELDKLISTGSEKEILFTSSEMLADGYLYQCSQLTDKLITFQPNNSNYNYRKAYLLIEMATDYEGAIPYFEKAVLKTSRNWDMFNTNETESPTDAIYQLAKCYHMNNQLDEAKVQYNDFILKSDKKSPNVFLAKVALQQIEVAKIENAKAPTATILNLQFPVNTNAPEYSPVISLDGSALYYTSRKAWGTAKDDENRDPRFNQLPEDVYVSYKDFDDTWIQSFKLDFCEISQNEATIAVSPDERRIYLYKDTEGNGDLFYSNIVVDKFKKIEHLNDRNINTSAWETHGSISVDGKFLFFVSDRKGGFGGRDIYKCIKQADGSWGKPENCGPTINTRFDEESPFVSVDNQYLYFSSNGEKSMGGFDIFKAKLDGTGNWSNPINVGVPFNSTCDDLFYTTTYDGRTGYFTSFRKGGVGEKDIYEIKIIDPEPSNAIHLTGNIHNLDKTPFPEDLSMNLECSDCITKEKVIFPRLRDGFFYSTLEPCKEYTMVFTFDSGKKEAYREKLNTNCKNEGEEIYKEIWLKRQELFHINGIAGKVEDQVTREPLSDVAVVIFDEKGNKILGTVKTNAEGVFVSDTLRNLIAGNEMNLKFSLEKQGYIPVELSLVKTVGGRFMIDAGVLDMKKIEIGTDLAIILNPIYFDYNKADIRPDAALELDKIIEIMQQNPKMVIALGSHTDARGSDDLNRKLAKRRAISSVDYIVSKGISKKRITGKGYGEDKLKKSNDEINAMKTGAEKDVAHQLNRRTEFIVVKK